MDTFALTMAIAASVLGCILGSFINALSFRFNTGKSVMHGRSRCMTCTHTLSALDLVPILSFVFLGGRCRYCGARIDWQYPLVEITGGVLGYATFLLHPTPLGFVFWMLVWMTLLFIVVYDMRHTIIPWSASGLLLVCALLSLFVSFDGGLVLQKPTFDALIAGPLLAFPLFFFSLVSGGRWMGWGDSGLELSLGWLLGLGSGLSALMIGFWSGACVGVVLLALAAAVRHSRVAPTSGLLSFARGVTMRSEVPFAPFLIFGAAAASFLHANFLTHLTTLFQ